MLIPGDYTVCPIMFYSLVCTLLSFGTPRVSWKFETQETGEIVVECTSYSIFSTVTLIISNMIMH